MHEYVNGVYIERINRFPNEVTFEREAAYYLKYNSSKGLYALKKLKEIEDSDMQEYSFMCHVFLDMLFDAVGLIINRFKPHSQANEHLKIQAQKNVDDYEYNLENYPLLNDKSFRNFLEHIDERDAMLLDKNCYWGTFNVIYSKMDKNSKDELLDKKQKQNNLLNLEEFTYSILEINEENIEEKSIDLRKLEDELKKVNEISNKLWNYLNI